MKLSNQLKQTRAAKAEEARGIYSAADTANRAPTAEEKTKFDGLMAEVDALTTRIDAQLRIEASLIDNPATPPAASLTTEPARATAVSINRHGPLKAFRAQSFGGSVAEAEKAAFQCGQWLLALAGNKKALAYCTENGVFSYGSRQVFAVHEEGANSTGGILVPTQFEQAVIDLREEYGMFRKWAKSQPMTSDYLVKPRRVGGLTAYPVAESGAYTESSKTWDSITLTAKKWGVLAKYTTELAEDSVVSISDDLTQEAAYAFAVAEDGAGIDGAGEATYAGIVGTQKKFFDANASSWPGAISTATHDLFSEVDADDLDKMVAALPLFARRSAKWYISPYGKALVFDPLLRAAGGNTKTDIAGAMYNSYLGFPIVESVAMNSTTSAIDEIAMFYLGDLQLAATIGWRRGITVQLLNELYAANGQIGLIASERFDINVHDIGSSSAAGPLVALIGETS